MINALLLIFDPANTWERIETAQPNVAKVFLTFLLPVMLLGFATEGFLLARFGEVRGIQERLSLVPQDLAVRYAVIYFGLSLLLVFGGSWLLRNIGAAFHRRHSFAECFTTLSYSLSPLFLLRIVDGFPFFNTWVCWAVGIFLAVAALYRGIPRILKPDPSSALGLYMLSSLLLIVMTGVVHYLATLILQGKILVNGWPV